MALFSETIALLIRADTGGAVGPLRNLERQAGQTATAWDRAGKKIGVSGATLKAGLAGIAASLSAETVIRGIVQVSQEYANAAKAAGDLANATGSSIEQISAMQAALVDAGVSAEQSAAMLNRFVTVSGTAKGVSTLRALNVELVRGQSGAVDYAASMTVTVDAIMALGDAAQRNAAFVALFGRQGAAAFQDLMASGLSFAEAQRAIETGRILTGEDYRNAQAYDAVLDSLNATVGELSIALGRGLVPALTDAAEGLAVLADAVPAPALEAIGATISPLIGALGVVGDLFGDGAEAAENYAKSTTTAGTAQEQLTAVIASGVTSGEEFAAAVAAAGDELAAQESNARLAAQALDIYRASTDQAYEATLNLLSLDRSERSAQRSAEGAADAAGDAKANLDKALATAKEAKTVVEKIAAIRGRERKKEETAGIIAGSTDVREIEAIKGRKAQTKTRVVEAAGVITPAEARAIREATRQYEEALDDISDAWVRLGESRVKHKEALGLTLTEAEKLNEVRLALKEGLQIPGLSAEAKEDIKADLAVVEGEIAKLGGVPVVIDGIKFKEGTTEAELTNLRNRIRDAGQAGNTAVVNDLSAKLEALRVGGVADLNVALGLDPASVTASQAALANLGIDPKTGKPYEAKTVATVDKTKAQQDLEALTKDRTVTVTVDVVPGATGFNGPGPINIGPPTTGITRLNFGGAQTVSFNPTVVNNYPLPERASDSVASSLRTAKYMVGLS